MVSCSNFVFVLLNFISFVIGLTSIILAFSIFPSHGHGSYSSICHSALHIPFLVVGLALTIISILGLIGACCRYNFLLYIYSFVMFLWIVGLIAFTVCAILITNPGAGEKLSGIGFKEYKLGNYSRWLQKHFVNEKRWPAIQSCLIDAGACKSLSDKTRFDREVSDFYRKQLTSIQSGCCKPPVDCSFQYKNATYWAVGESGPATTQDKDCTVWSNDQTKLCYNCDSCKGGVLANIKKQWRHLAVFNIVIILLAVFAYSTGCSATRDIAKDRRMHYGRIAFP